MAAPKCDLNNLSTCQPNRTKNTSFPEQRQRTCCIFSIFFSFLIFNDLTAQHIYIFILGYLYLYTYIYIGFFFFLPNAPLPVYRIRILINLNLYITTIYYIYLYAHIGNIRMHFERHELGSGGRGTPFA